MEVILAAAEQTLRRAGVPALRLSALLDEVRTLTGMRSLDPERLRHLLEARPDRFRVLDPWRGPWRFVASAPGPAQGETWVVVVHDDGDAPGEGESPGVARRLHASVRWLALHVDPASARTVMRWKGLLLEALDAHDALGRAA